VLLANCAGALTFALLLKRMAWFESGIGEELSKIGAKGYTNGFWPT
jgi:hypothetical protein